MIGNHTRIAISELRAVVVQVRVPEANSRFASRVSVATYAAFLLILLGSVRAGASSAFLPSFVPNNEESRMRTLQSLGVVSSIAIASVASAQNAVQWRVADGGNGHWYAGFTVTTPEVSWGAARSLAQQRGGDLVCLNSPPETAWVFQSVASNPVLWRGNFGPWTGGTRGSGSTWRWTDGTQVQDPFPWATGQPDNWLPCGGQENCIVFWPISASGEPQLLFADFPENGKCVQDGSSVGGFVVEWSADCNNDGIVDYGQIRDGSLADVNGDNIPDCCALPWGCDTCPADIDQSGAVNGVDLAAILNVWSTSGGKYPRADINRDGIVNGADLAEVLNAWGPCP